MSQIEQLNSNVMYTCHINWSWVVDQAVGRTDISDSSPTRVRRRKELPSQGGPSIYSLFRVEVVGDSPGRPDRGVWATSSIFEYLDAKDALYRHLLDAGAENVMPETKLLSWDCCEQSLDGLPSTPALLKAALGSGGDSLYFVYSPQDVLSVCRKHAQKARSVPGFIDELERTHGIVPSWSLQEVYPSMLLTNSRKCQIRAYVVYCNGALYLYSDYEVRQPIWEHIDPKTTDISSLSASLQADIHSCEGSQARPYNHGRSKVKTDRMLLQEVDELSGDMVHSAITDLMLRAFRALHPTLQKQKVRDANEYNIPPSFVLKEVAVAGVDILINKEYVPKIVEVNNNPAMPQPHKNMSARYRDHLVDFVHSIIKLGIDDDSSRYIRIW